MEIKIAVTLGMYHHIHTKDVTAVKKDLKILEQVPAVKEELEEVAREGARRLLRQAMEEEVQEFLGRKR
ncbi:MAG: hypothetical protein M1421_06365 [Candidatus Eremiobacteraeota bacterium]|nr:hypothetical protein [Candidatus Eremiobacteraeota bacterium]